MLQPIQKDNDLVCQNCGCVVGQVESYPEPEKSTIQMSADVLILGSAVEKNVKQAFPRTAKQSREESGLKLLTSITKSFALPESLAIDAFNILKKKNSSFYSELETIKQLIKILSKDDNYFYIHKLRAIKEKYKYLGI